MHKCKVALYINDTTRQKLFLAAQDIKHLTLLRKNFFTHHATVKLALECDQLMFYPNLRILRHATSECIFITIELTD